MDTKFVSRKIALEKLGLSPMTLLKLEKNNQIEVIRTIGGQRKYNVDKYINENKKCSTVKNELSSNKLNSESTDNSKLNICYIRVSTYGQKDDISRQRNYMKNKYPGYKIIEDIGSGINFNRKGFRKIVNLAIAGKVDILVVAHKDRLTRFGFEFIEDLINEYSNGKIIVESNKLDKKEPKEELVEDVLQILNVYTAKMNGMRKYGRIE